ncbi:MAG: butyrate kinase [Firmicutes bacterium HGW-Firmicutes-15]|nr:MAG: butyrate kinase [Firmicutes bacterium HGW-Firmicutes-15]
MNILAINPGSTSTKVGYFKNTEEVYSKSIQHNQADLNKYVRISQQVIFRIEAIREALRPVEQDLPSLDAVVGRGGYLRPLISGTYRINHRMLDDLITARYGEHASNLGAVLAFQLAEKYNADGSYIVDPVVVDEMAPLARFSGHPAIQRRSLFHALNQKATGHYYAQQAGKGYNEINLIIAHLGGGASIGIHQNGRVIDVNNALDGDGPFSAERTGGLPMGDLLRLGFERDEKGAYFYDQERLLRLITREGGLLAYAGTNKLQEVEEQARVGNSESVLLLEAMAYQVAKDIGAGATVLKGKVDAIILTGGMSFSDWLTTLIRERVEFIAPVTVVPGEKELEALVEGVLRVHKGEELVLEY